MMGIGRGHEPITPEHSDAQDGLYRACIRCGGGEVVEGEPPTVVCEHEAAEVKDGDLPTREEHRRASEEVDAVETSPESTRGCRIEPL